MAKKKPVEEILDELAISLVGSAAVFVKFEKWKMLEDEIKKALRKAYEMKS